MHRLLPRPSRSGLRRAAWFLTTCVVLSSAQAAEPGLLVGRVSRVHDGDSLSLQQGRHRVMVRLAAIDAPEITQPHGEAAHAALRACALGRVVTVTVRGSDPYGRRVGRLDSAGQDCGLALLRDGLAWHSTYDAHQQPPGDNLAYSMAERRARLLGIGLWAEAAPVPPWVYRRQGGTSGMPTR